MAEVEIAPLDDLSEGVRATYSEELVPLALIAEVDSRALQQSVKKVLAEGDLHENRMYLTGSTYADERFVAKDAHQVPPRLVEAAQKNIEAEEQVKMFRSKRDFAREVQALQRRLARPRALMAAALMSLAVGGAVFGGVEADAHYQSRQDRIGGSTPPAETGLLLGALLGGIGGAYSFFGFEGRFGPQVAQHKARELLTEAEGGEG